MRFLVDEQLPAALAKWLTDHGQASDHVDDVGLSGRSDGTIWDYAARTSAVVITKDEDFVYLQTKDTSGPAVGWVRMGMSEPMSFWPVSKLGSSAYSCCCGMASA